MRADKDKNRFFDDNLYSQTWSRQPQPDPGAESYAFETLALYALTPVGPGVGLVKGPLHPLAAPLYTLQSVPLQGIPTTAGQIYRQPLQDPDLTSPDRLN